MYYQLHLSHFTTDPDLLSDTLTELGALAVTLENADADVIYEPKPGSIPLWKQVKLTALFQDEAILNAALTSLQASDPKLQYSIGTLPDQAWERAWMDEFHPLKIGNRTWICPSWCEPPDLTAVNLLLDPGLAFGTGTHPTTALCLEWIDGEDFKNKTVLDYGCGSGILGIAALLHGANKVDAVDYDPQALEATLENAKRNKIDLNTLNILKPEALDENLKVDMILANILAEPLITLAPRFATHLKPAGKIVLSGILQDQTESIIAAYTPFFTDFEVIEKEEWIRVSASLSESAPQPPAP